jgi:predicted DNA-binding helix-hairpin-helix protein
MQITHAPDAQERLERLSELAALDCDGEPTLTCPQSAKADFLARSVVQVRRPDGALTVLRTMQTSACERNCYYCAFRAGRGGFPRLSLRPDEMARGFDAMQRAGVVSGLFLSSGIGGSVVKTMDAMLATVELVRRKYRYRGYIHLKILPGAQAAHIEQAMRLADRVSINLEGASADRLGTIAPQKDFERDLLSAMRTVHRVAGAQGLYARVPSLVTQFVVGPAGESDQELLTTASQLYREVHLSRAYYSGFSPIQDTPLAGLPATPPLREHRLYQADWLLRYYGFALEELPFEPDGGLPSAADPKLVWARRHLAERPVEVNRCSRCDLLRVPGIGPRTADTILSARRDGRLRDAADLRALGVAVNRALPFILMNGRRPAHQLSLW